MQTQEGLEAHYRDLTHGLYDPFVEGAYRGGPGYTPEEREGILGEERLRDLQLRPGEVEEMAYTPTEQQQIMGDLDAERAYFNPELQFGIQREGTARQREAIGEMERGMRGAVDPGMLRASPDFMRGMEANVGATERAFGEAIDPTKLALSQRFQERFPMTDAERAEIQGQAATDVGSRYAGYLDRLKRRATAAGAGWRGMEALEGRLGREGAIGGADAMTNARIAAGREQAERERQMEGMRLGAEGGLAQMRFGAAGELGGLRYRTQMGAEGTRLGAEQGLTDRQMEAFYRPGMARWGMERGIGEAEQDIARDVRGFGAGQQRYIEAQKSGRAGELAGARTGLAGWKAGQRYERGKYGDIQRTGRMGAVAEARRGDEAEARRWGAGQERYHGGRYDVGAGQRIQGFGTATGAAGQAGQVRTGWAGRPKWWQTAIPGAARAGSAGIQAAWGGG
jgi:hypothetical protein